MKMVESAAEQFAAPLVSSGSEPWTGSPGPAEPSKRDSGRPDEKFGLDVTSGNLPGRLGSWHLPAGQTLSKFCGILNSRGVAYAILPSTATVSKRQQVAMLVADKDIPRVRGLITRAPFGQQLAVYSTSGLPGFSFQQHWRRNSDATNMAVLPPYLADDLLARAQLDERGFRVPSTQDKLLWEICRALYFMGNEHFAPGSNTDESPILVGSSAQIVSALARTMAANLSEPLTLESLDDYLSTSGWQLPHDVLRRLSSWNSWAASKLQKSTGAQLPDEPGLTAFFVRREALAAGLQADIASTLEACGFEFLKTIDLNESQRETAARASRGANWGGGALPVNGGPPVSIIIAFDVLPSQVTDEEREQYPFLDNGRTLAAKLMCRQFIQDKTPRSLRFNPLHASDDSGEAWRIVRMFAAEDEQALRDIIESRKAAMSTSFEVVRTLTRKAARAKVELIQYGGGMAVKKTYRQNCLRYLEREAAFLEAVSPERPEILPVLERGPNYFIMPFVDGRPLRRNFFGRGFPRLMTLRHVRDVADLLRYLFSRGYDPIDLAPHNLLVDRAGRVTAIDFEFVHQTGRPIEPEQSACLDGIKDDFDGEWPAAARWAPLLSKARRDPYSDRWYGYTALSRKSFLHDTAAVQRIKRMVNYPAYLGAKTFVRLHQLLRDYSKHALRRRMPVLTRIAVNALRSPARRPRALR